MENSTEELLQILSKMPGHVYWTDLNGVILGCNEAQALFAGFSSSQEMIGKRDHDLPWGDNAKQITEANNIVFTTGKTQVFEEEIQLPTGETVYFMSKKMPRFDYQGNVIGLIGISIDITSKKQAEILRHEKETQEKLIKHLKIIAGAIGHEMRTPLASIRFLTQMLQRSEKENSVVNSTAEKILSSIDYMNAFITMMLSNMRAGSNIDTSKYQALSLAPLVNEVVSNYPCTGNEKELIHIDIVNDFTFHGDKHLMKNVLVNLLKNSLYYIKSAGKGEIFIRLESNKLFFKDTAEGAPQSVLEKMFDEFFSQRELGTGLGLAFCKKVIESFSGSISVKSVEGEFIEFEITL